MNAVIYCSASFISDSMKAKKQTNKKNTLSLFDFFVTFRRILVFTVSSRYPANWKCSSNSFLFLCAFKALDNLNMGLVFGLQAYFFMLLTPDCLPSGYITHEASATDFFGLKRRNTRDPSRIKTMNQKPQIALSLRSPPFHPRCKWPLWTSGKSNKNSSGR